MTFQVPVYPRSKLPPEYWMLWCEQDETCVAHAWPWTVLKESSWWKDFVLRKGENGFITYMENVCPSDADRSLGLHVLLALPHQPCLRVSTCAQFRLKECSLLYEDNATVPPRHVFIENLNFHKNNTLAYCTILKSVDTGKNTHPHSDWGSEF